LWLNVPEHNEIHVHIVTMVKYYHRIAHIAMLNVSFHCKKPQELNYDHPLVYVRSSSSIYLYYMYSNFCEYYITLKVNQGGLSFADHLRHYPDLKEDKNSCLVSILATKFVNFWKSTHIKWASWFTLLVDG